MENGKTKQGSFLSLSLFPIYISSLFPSLSLSSLYLSTSHWKQPPDPHCCSWLLLLWKACTGNTELLGFGNTSGNCIEQKVCLPLPPPPPPPLQATPTTARGGEISAKDLELLSCCLLLKAWKPRALGFGGCGVSKALASGGCLE